MVKYKEQEAEMVKAVADKTRYDILDRLIKSRELSAGEIAEKYDMSFPAVSKHLRVLKDAQLVSVEQIGRSKIYSPNITSVQRMSDWVHNAELFWKGSLDNLAAYIESKEG